MMFIEGDFPGMGQMQDETTNIDRDPLKTDPLMPPRTEISAMSNEPLATHMPVAD